MRLKNRSWIEILMPKSERGKCGENFNRKNFYFEPLKSDSEKIVMRYEHETLSATLVQQSKMAVAISKTDGKYSEIRSVFYELYSLMEV